MSNIIYIFKGWTNFLLDVNSDLARERAEQCKDCDSAVIGFHNHWLNDEVKEVKGLKCFECGCPLSAKLRTKEEKCPLNKW